MINGIHAIVYALDADKVRAFLRDVLGFKSVDAGHGWLIFALPPAELAAHPQEHGKEVRHELYLMCDDLEETMNDLKSKGVKCGEMTQAGWGSVTTIEIPGGGRMGLYEPRHPTAITRNG
jgi:catechol 2,3-dioxygenase-like lactoylglutathione lyase family enzyme